MDKRLTSQTLPNRHRPPTTRSFKIFFKSSPFQVKYRGAVFNIRLMTAGVPQGSPLSPTLFNIFPHDMPLSDNLNSKKALYANESTTMVTYKSPWMITHALQLEIDILQDWFNTWRIDDTPLRV